MITFFIKTLKNNRENELSFAKLLIEKERANKIIAYYIGEWFSSLEVKLLFVIE